MSQGRVRTAIGPSYTSVRATHTLPETQLELLNGMRIPQLFNLSPSGGILRAILASPTKMGLTVHGPTRASSE